MNPAPVHSAASRRDAVTGTRNPHRLNAVARAELTGHLDDPDLDAVVATLRIACDVPIAVVNIVSADRQTYPAEVGIGAPCTDVPDELSFCAQVVDSGEALAIEDARSHPVYSHNPMVRDGVIGAYAGVPLVDDGFVLGSVSIFDDRVRTFSPDVLQILEHQARLAGSVLTLRRAARTDLLTGLPNRGLFLDRLTRALARLERQPGTACVLYLDIDRFKALNDTYGHHVGDAVLRELGRRVAGVLRPTDTLARLGGDEFVAVCEGLLDTAEAERVAARVLEATLEPWCVSDDAATVPVTVSIGLAVTVSADTQPKALVREADGAMYLAKHLGGGRLVLAACPTADRPTVIPIPRS